MTEISKLQLQAITVTAEAGIDADAVTKSPQFAAWLAGVDATKFVVKSIHIQSMDMFGKRIGFVKFKAEVTDISGKAVSGIVFLRGGSVGMLPVLRCEGKEYTVLTVQPRFATGNAEFAEIPAGMLDGSGNFTGVAAKELDEELGIKVEQSELTDLTALAGQASGFWPSPGASEETIRLYTFTRDVTADELAAMNGKLTGCLTEGEQITLKIVPLDAGLLAVPDGKTIVAYALYKEFVAKA